MYQVEVHKIQKDERCCIEISLQLFERCNKLLLQLGLGLLLLLVVQVFVLKGIGIAGTSFTVGEVANC